MRLAGFLMHHVIWGRKNTALGSAIHTDEGERKGCGPPFPLSLQIISRQYGRRDDGDK